MIRTYQPKKLQRKKRTRFPQTYGDQERPQGACPQKGEGQGLATH